jgi:hypothetical protein
VWSFKKNNRRFFIAQKYSSKESPALWVLKKNKYRGIASSWHMKQNQNQRIASSGYFKHFKELSGFMKEPAKIWLFSIWLRTMVVYNNWLFDFLIL